MGEFKWFTFQGGNGNTAGFELYEDLSEEELQEIAVRLENLTTEDGTLKKERVGMGVRLADDWPYRVLYGVAQNVAQSVLRKDLGSRTINTQDVEDIMSDVAVLVIKRIVPMIRQNKLDNVGALISYIKKVTRTLAYKAGHIVKQPVSSDNSDNNQKNYTYKKREFVSIDDAGTTGSDSDEMHGVILDDDSANPDLVLTVNEDRKDNAERFVNAVFTVMSGEKSRPYAVLGTMFSIIVYPYEHAYVKNPSAGDVGRASKELVATPSAVYKDFKEKVLLVMRNCLEKKLDDVVKCVFLPETQLKPKTFAVLDNNLEKTVPTMFVERHNLDEQQRYRDTEFGVFGDSYSIASWSNTIREALKKSTSEVQL